ncbi:MAG: hypothetical protein ACKO37_08075, partial [Vampirovibrionales bacterium]
MSYFGELPPSSKKPFASSQQGEPPVERQAETAASAKITEEKALSSEQKKLMTYFQPSSQPSSTTNPIQPATHHAEWIKTLHQQGLTHATQQVKTLSSQKKNASTPQSLESKLLEKPTQTTHATPTSKVSSTENTHASLEERLLKNRPSDASLSASATTKVAVSGELAKQSKGASVTTPTEEEDALKAEKKDQTRPNGQPLQHPDRDLPLPIATLTSAGRGVGRWFTDTAKAFTKPENLMVLGASALGLAALGAVSAPAAATVAGALTIAGGIGAGVQVIKGVGKAIHASQKGEQGKDDYLYAIEDTAKASVDLGLSALGTKGATTLKQSKSLVQTEKRLAHIGDDIAKLNQKMLQGVEHITPKNNRKLASLLAEQHRLSSEAGRLKTHTLVTKLSQERSGLLSRETQLKVLDDQLAQLPAQSPARSALEKTRNKLEGQLTKQHAQVQSLREELLTQANQNMTKLQDRLSVGQAELKASGGVNYLNSQPTQTQQSYRTLRQLMDHGVYVESQLKRSTKTLDTLHGQLKQATQSVEKHRITQAIQQEEALQQQALAMHRTYSDVLSTLDQLDTTKALLSQGTPSFPSVPTIPQGNQPPKWLTSGVHNATQQGKKVTQHASVKALETQLNHQQAQLQQAYHSVSQLRNQHLMSSGTTLGGSTLPRIPTAHDASEAYRQFKSADVRLQKAQSQALGSDIDLHELTLQRNEALEHYLDLASNPSFKQAALQQELARASEKQRRLENVEGLLQGEPLRHTFPSAQATPLEMGKAFTQEQLARIANFTLNQPKKAVRLTQEASQKGLANLGLYPGEPLPPYQVPYMPALREALGDNQVRLADVRASLASPTWQGKVSPSHPVLGGLGQPFQETWDAIKMPGKTLQEVTQRLNPF